jgi:hypothetical protein
MSSGVDGQKSSGKNITPPPKKEAVSSSHSPLSSSYTFSVDKN